ncbi:hypothetical protein J4444_02290 [Candidatus Woesearchaeota archaeon]|nr:hypothetical protein [Candidatus Woesearchaeota archaeon]
MTRLWTKDFRLERIALHDFEAMEKSWGHVMPKGRYLNDPTYLKVLNPLSAGTYGELIDYFLDHPHPLRINVRRGREWRYYHRERLGNPSVVDEVIKIASADPKQTNHFEMYFKCGPSQYGANIEFCKKDNRIVGHRLEIPGAEAGLFRLDHIRGNWMFEGIGDPNSRKHFRI